MAGSSDDPKSPSPAAAIVPTVRLLTVSTLFPGEKLDKELSNWIAWKQAMFQYMGTSRLIRYTKSNAKSFRPDQVLDPIGYDNWTQNDECACAYIHGAISANEHLALGSQALTEDAAALWALLEARHKDDGPVTQVSLIREAMGLRATADDFTTAPKEIVRIMERVFSMGPISNDTYTNFIILHSFSELQDMQFNIQDQLKMASKESPATPLTVLNYLREKQKIIDSNSSARTATSIALAARSTPSPKNNKSRQALFCTGCKSPTHTHPYCIREGGGMAGKSIEESKAQRRKDIEAAKGKASSTGPTGGGASNRVAVAHTDSNGKAFISYVDPSALFSAPGSPAYANLASVDVDNVAFSTEDLEHHAFPLFHTVDVAGAYINTDAPEEPLPVNPTSLGSIPAWMTINGDITSSVDWNVHSRPTDLAAISADAPNQATRTVASSEEFPFYLDSGATTHISPSRDDFFSLRPIASRPVKGVGGTSIFATGIGEIRLRIARGAWVVLLDVLFIPTAAVRLISVSAIARDSKIVSHFDDTSCWLTSKSTGAVIATGTLLPKTRLYSLPLHSPQADHAYTIHRAADLETWHRRLGHANYQCVAGLARKGKVNGMSPSLATSKVSKCEPCLLGKQTKTIVPKTRGGKDGEGNRATRTLGVVWIDLTGPHAVTSRTGNRYTVDIVDDHTSRGWTFPIPKKSDAFDRVLAWEKMVEAETGLKIGKYRTDQGELKSNKMRAWLEGKGTQHEFTAPYTSAHCGRVERRHRTLMGKANAMRIYAGCPPNLWDEFYLTASFLDERTPTASLKSGITPYEAYYNRAPDYARLREIGC